MVIKMKHIKTINLKTGEEKIVPANIYLLNSIQIEISGCKRTIREHPDIGTVLDGSRFATQKVLESLEKKVNDIIDKEILFTDFYKTLLYDIETLNEICNNTDVVSVKCILIGQKMAYQIVKGLIEDINKCEDVSNLC